MSEIYQALHLAQQERLTNTNELNHEPSTALPKPTITINPQPTQRFHEDSELSALAQNIATHLPSPHQRVIQFIGSRIGEGTSTLIREFAVVVAQQSSKPVLLVQAANHQFSQAQTVAFEATPPLDDALREEKPLDTVISQVEQSNLFQAHLSSHFFRSLTDRSRFHSTDMWKVARNQFSLILIDSEPIETSTDSLAICEFVNGVVLVIAAEKTRSAVVQNLKREILRREGNLLGIVFTKRKFHIPNAIHKHL